MRLSTIFAPIFAAYIGTNAAPLTSADPGEASLQFFLSASAGQAACVDFPKFSAFPDTNNCNNIPLQDDPNKDFFAVNVTSIGPGCQVKLFGEECDPIDSLLGPGLSTVGQCGIFQNPIRSFQVDCD